MRAMLACALVAGCAGAAPRPSEPAPRSEIDWTGGLSEAEFIALHEHTSEAAPAPRGEEIELGDARAYLSLPEGASAPMPAIVVIHEWWGLNDHVRHWADRLASEGYAALAVDLYGGEVATDPERAMALVRQVDPERAIATVREAHRFLSEDPRVAAPRTAVIGWCFGGGMALRAALAIEELDAAVMYYGQVIDDPEELASMRAPLLGIFANQDTSITPERVGAFERALAEAGVEHAIHRYDADHAFANPSGSRYAREPSEDAWEHVRAFLAAHLRGD